MPIIAPGPRGLWDLARTVDLRQIGERPTGVAEFEVLSEFGYTARKGAGPWEIADVEILVPAGMHTDLATVPAFLWGVVASYGRITLPAILHDLQCYGAANEADPLPHRRRARREADALFRRNLHAAAMGPLRRWLVWAGVRFGGRLGMAYALAGAILLASAAVLVAPSYIVPALALGAALVLGTAVASSFEGTRAEPTRFSPRALGSLLGATGLGLVSLPLLLPVSVLTIVTAAALRLGEAPPSHRPAMLAFLGEEQVRTRVEWRSE